MRRGRSWEKLGTVLLSWCWTQSGNSATCNACSNKTAPCRCCQQHALQHGVPRRQRDSADDGRLWRGARLGGGSHPRRPRAGPCRHGSNRAACQCLTATRAPVGGCCFAPQSLHRTEYSQPFQLPAVFSHCMPNLQPSAAHTCARAYGGPRRGTATAVEAAPAPATVPRLRVQRRGAVVHRRRGGGRFLRHHQPRAACQDEQQPRHKRLVRRHNAAPPCLLRHSTCRGTSKGEGREFRQGKS